MENVSLSDCRYMIHECNRYLFLAKVNCEKKIDDKVEFESDPINYLETLFNLPINHSNEEQEIHSFSESEISSSSEIPLDNSFSDMTLSIEKDEKEIIFNIFNKIEERNWDEINIQLIEQSQEILYGLLLDIKEHL